MSRAAPALSRGARLLRMYRARPSVWVRHKVKIQLARYRDRTHVERWLATQDPDGHAWLRRQLLRPDFVLDGTRSYQGEALDTMAVPGRVLQGQLHGGRYALQWANGGAKTATAALLAHWFLDCYPGGKLLTSAGTWSQLKEQLWREIAYWAGQALAPIAANCAPRGIGKVQVDIAPDWAAIGRAADKGETFEGVHGRYVMVILDEAKAVPQGIFDAIRRILRGAPDCLFWFVALSSPGSPTGPFWDITNGDLAHRWATLRLCAYQTERVSLEQVAEDAQDLGEDSPLFIAMDLGEFPTETEDTLIPLSHAQAAVGRTVSREDSKTLGIDVARLGGDLSSLVQLIGRQALPPLSVQGKRTTWIAEKARELHRQKKFDRIATDDTGVGGGVTDMLIASGAPVLPVNFGATDLLKQPDIYANNKTEMYAWLARELKAGYEETQKAADAQDPDVGLSLPAGPQGKRLVHQLTSQRVHFDGRRYRLEGHAELRKRGVKSPDEADALALANWARMRRGRRYLVPDAEERGDPDPDSRGDSLTDTMLREAF